MTVRSAFAPAVIALVALIASLARWLLQGSRNFYTAFEKQFYVPDPDAGWAISGRGKRKVGSVSPNILFKLPIGATATPDHNPPSANSPTKVSSSSKTIEMISVEPR